MGESGSGKTTSMRNLDPEITCYIDCDKKGLSWKGWKEQYNKDKRNYLKTDEQNEIMTVLKWLNQKEGFKFKTVIIDTINGIMVADEMRRSKEKNYDKWQDLAQAIYDIVDFALKARDDLTVIFTAHTQTERDESGYQFTRIKTSGKKLDKIVLESKFTTVLLAKVVGGKYLFETQAKNSTAKSPMGAFDEFEIENDITKVIKALEEY
jgi:hypothetical protein